MAARSYEVIVDVSARVDLDGALRTAATVWLPERVDGPLTVLVAYPGGGYSRGYYDIDLLPGYSEAEYHAAQGFAFVACDHLGAGDSTACDPFDLTFERLAAADDATASSVVDRLRNGTLADGVPPVAVERVIGLGQSMGGCLLTVQQARHRTFDAVGFLGWSGIGSNFPAPDGSRLTVPAPPRGADLREFAERALGAVAQNLALIRYCFHAADEEAELVEADLGSPADALPRWRSAARPAAAASMMAPGVVADDAAAIDVPVLIACGDIDVVPDPWAEPTAYRGSRDVSVCVVPRMCHMHNFARTREVLWDRVAAFARAVRT
ncbi:MULTISPECIES: alpha/beta hydrolase [unclassified Pseudofrankia]|uniref:alpha/beta hydrolase n=1 Tax=unclassified Pseudofrankia TaxID=2994372 RepID=UPI0008DABF44|nr:MULTISPECIES: hypothetical protein [unclassified Pseudofrankia]MDT3442217.1 alpha/beta hydrolase [Pseudofrankia sp. BMG5.37]OHV43570.1 hypothetical protein BCD48_27740 [Pseudofrankia sp. BMG5.36]